MKTFLLRAVLILGALCGAIALAQQGPGAFGGSHQMADLFKVFFTWTATNILTSGGRAITSTSGAECAYGMSPASGTFHAVCFNATGGGNTSTVYIAESSTVLYLSAGGNISLSPGSGNRVITGEGYTSTIASGSSAFAASNSGAKWNIGPSVSSTLEEVSNGYLTSPAYIASATPFTLSDVYVNNTVAALTYGGAALPARAFTVTDIGYSVRAAGTGGSTNNTFRVSDGTNTCLCTFACSITTGSKIAACANGAGTGCVFAASAALTYGFSAVGDCTGPTDLLGNVSVRGKWQ